MVSRESQIPESEGVVRLVTSAPSLVPGDKLQMGTHCVTFFKGSAPPLPLFSPYRRVPPLAPALPRFPFGPTLIRHRTG